MNAIPGDWALSNRAALYLKVFAVVMMTLDHVDTGLLVGGAGMHATVGRTVFPIFAVLLGMNLARIPRPNKLTDLSVRMALFGLLAAVPYVYVYGLLPLNIMFTLAAAVLVVQCWRTDRLLLAGVVFLFAGLWVDYSWCGLVAVVGAWWLIRQGYRLEWVAVFVGLVLVPVNGNAWALLAAPLVAVAPHVVGDAPRAKWLFYAFYPGHLAVIALVKALA